MNLTKTFAIAGGLLIAALAGSAAAAPPLTDTGPVGTPHPTGVLQKNALGGRTLAVKDVPITCTLGSAGQNAYNVFFKSSTEVTGKLHWTAWKSCVGDAGCYLGRTNVVSGDIAHYSSSQPGGWPFIHDGMQRDACEAKVTTIGG